MAVNRRRTVIVGAFVGGTIVMLALLLLWVAGSHFFRPVERYHVVFDGSVSGLLAGAAVKLNGVEIGKVSDVDLTDDSPPRVDVTFEVPPHTPIQRDTVARLEGNLVTGIQSVELGGGTKAAGPLPHDVPLKGTVISIDDLQKSAGKATREAAGLLVDLRADTLNHDNRVALGGLIQDLAAMAKSMKVIAADLAEPDRMKQINSTIKNISDSSAHLSEVATHADRVMASLDSRLSDATGRLDKTLTRVDTALDTATGLMRTTQTVMNHNTFEIDRSLKQLNSATGISIGPSIRLAPIPRL